MLVNDANMILRLEAVSGINIRPSSTRMSSCEGCIAIQMPNTAQLRMQPTHTRDKQGAIILGSPALKPGGDGAAVGMNKGNPGVPRFVRPRAKLVI